MFIPFIYLNLIGIENRMYIYRKDNETYLTSKQPDGTVPAKRISVHKQRGSRNSRKYKPVETKNNTWKRFFIIPKKFFPYVSEDKLCKFTFDPTEKDIFSGKPAVLKMELIDGE